MPVTNRLLNWAMILFFFLVFMVTLWFGPGRRIYLSPPRVESVSTTAQLAAVWKDSGVRGRTLVCFTRYLNAAETVEAKNEKTTEKAMETGIARRVFHVVPDNAWAEVSRNLAKMNGVRADGVGYIGIFENGRVYIQPLSRFVPPAETSLVVVEPHVWGEQEKSQISSLLSSRKLDSDLVIVIRGGEKDVTFFRQAISR